MISGGLIVSKMTTTPKAKVTSVLNFPTNLKKEAIFYGLSFTT